MLDFAELYERHAPDVFRFALFLTRDRHAAEDLVSETFVRVWGARERLEIRTVKGYLLAIARNVFLRNLSRRRRETSLDAAWPAPGPGPDGSLECSQELAWTLQQLDRLPEIDRTALILRAEEDLSYDEIAAVLGLTPGAARVKVHRARKFLIEARRKEASS